MSSTYSEYRVRALLVRIPHFPHFPSIGAGRVFLGGVKNAVKRFPHVPRTDAGRGSLCLTNKSNQITTTSPTTTKNMAEGPLNVAINVPRSPEGAVVGSVSK